MRRVAFAGLILALFISCSSDREPANQSLSGEMEIKKSWMRSAEANTNSAGYLSIINGTAETDTLLSVSTDAFEAAEVHESYETDDGLIGMRPAKNMSIASGDSLVLKPGGMHIMLMNAQNKLTESDSVNIYFSFKKAGDKTIKIPVRVSY